MASVQKNPFAVGKKKLVQAVYSHRWHRCYVNVRIWLFIQCLFRIVELVRSGGWAIAPPLSQTFASSHRWYGRFGTIWPCHLHQSVSQSQAHKLRFKSITAWAPRLLCTHVSHVFSSFFLIILSHFLYGACCKLFLYYNLQIFIFHSLSTFFLVSFTIHDAPCRS